jgi:hypothetical protein
MKNIAVVISMFFFFHETIKAQPGALALNNVNASPYACLPLEDKGAFKQLRVQAIQSGNNGTWEFPQDCTFPGNVWRPYNAQSANAIPFNTIIPPLANTYAALWNSNNGGVSGKLSAVTSGRYYTFNIENVICNGGNCSSPNMSVLETPYQPATFRSVIQYPLPDSVGVGLPVTITVISSVAPSENVFIRYSTDTFRTSRIVPVTFTDTIGTARIPGFTLGTRVEYYVYGSPKTQSTIESDVVAIGQIVHDLYTLNWNVNDGQNYSYTVKSVVASQIRYLKGLTQSGYNELKWKVDCGSDSMNMTLERSNTNINYQTIYQTTATAAQCLQEFNYSDSVVSGNINYYRLYVRSSDGYEAYSDVVALLNGASTFEIIAINPTAVNGNQTTISLSSTKATLASIFVTDAKGSKLRKFTAVVNAGSQTEILDVSGLARGVYFVTAITSEGERRTRRFLKM